MRKLFLTIAAAIVVVVAGTLTGCKKHDVEIPPSHVPDFKTISYVLSHDSTFSLLDTALGKAGLKDSLNNSSSAYTLFAPDNAAFASSGITMATIDSMSAADLKTLLSYHLIKGSVSSSKLADSSSRQSVQGTSVYLSSGSGSTYVNGVKIGRPDIVASNGYIQGIVKVLVIPKQTIEQLLSANSSLSLFVAALNQSGLKDSISSGAWTVFAAVDSAFESAGYSDSTFAATDSVSKVKADSLVREQIVKKAIFSSSFTASFEPKTWLGDTLSFSGVSPMFTVKVKGSAAPASNVSKADKIATNGVLHVIDRVLKK